MTDSTQSTFRRRWRSSREYRVVVIVAFSVMVLGAFVGAHLYGRYLSAMDLGGRDNAIEQLRAESQKLKTHSDQLSAKVTDLQTKLTKAQASLQAIMPSANTYNIIPNQTLLVADGHLTVGMIGAPGNESVTLDINGKQQAVTAGQVVNVSDASGNCTVSVQSFDMFKAVIVASCPGAKKPQ